MAEEKTFGDLYKYSGADGKMTVIPDFPSVREKVAEGFKRIFTSDFVTDPETPNGVLIDSIAVLFFDTLGVTAQNANGMNINLSAGQLLDALGGIFGVQRLDGESDNSYRRRILDSQARGTGTAQSVRQALSNNVHVVNFSVLENIQHYPVALPLNSAATIAVDQHSIAVCVKMDSESNIDSALEDVYKTKSIGCGCSKISDAPESSERISDVTGIRIYSAVDKDDIYCSVYAKRTINYTGSDFAKEISDSVIAFVKDHSMCSVIYGSELSSYIERSVIGCRVESLVLSHEDGGIRPYDDNLVVVRPYEFAVVGEDNVSVEDLGNS